MNFFRCTKIMVLFQINTFKMHGREHGVHLFHFRPEHEVKSPYIIVLMAGEEHGIQVVINVFFKFAVIFYRDSSETHLDKAVMNQLVDIFRQSEKRSHPLQILC